jgi:hypothetical protein
MRAAAGNRDISAPISAMITCATFSPTPGMVCGSSIWVRGLLRLARFVRVTNQILGACITGS